LTHTVFIVYITEQCIYRPLVGNNVNTRYKPEKFDRKSTLVNTKENTYRVFTCRFLRYPQ